MTVKLVMLMTAPSLVNKSSKVKIVHAFRRQNLQTEANRTVEYVLLYELSTMRRNSDDEKPEGCSVRILLQMLSGQRLSALFVIRLCDRHLDLCGPISFVCQDNSVWTTGHR